MYTVNSPLVPNPCKATSLFEVLQAPCGFRKINVHEMKVYGRIPKYP